mmetsp:Transcript_86871/g.250650  ORF Transcript_86871/g.250650 Transcript_86871/m.250650 type:complete len:545 (+) Transcript_86871:136-1770(+)
MAEQTLTPQQIALSSNFQRVFLQHQQQQQQQLQQQQQQQRQQQLQQQQQQQQQQHVTQAQSLHHNSNQFGDSFLNQNSNFTNQDSLLFQLYQNIVSNPNQATANSSLLNSTFNNSNNNNSNSNSSNAQFGTIQSENDQDQRKGLLDPYRQLFGPVSTEPNNNNNNNSNNSNHSNNNSGAERFMLQSKVEPFTRESAYEDTSDLWKVFDDDFAQPGGTTKKLNLSLNNFAFLSQNQQQQIDSTTNNPVELPQAIESSNIYQSNTVSYQTDFDSEPFILPSTMIPPSVLALSSGESKKRAASNNDTAQKRKRLKHLQPSISPQACLENLMAQRGNKYQRISSDDAEYDAVPSALQLASFGTQLVKAVHTSDTGMLGRLLSCGLSPNPCNQFRDSILDLVCKRANEPIFGLLMEMGADLQVVDGFGRTPLHHACWASTFCAPIVENILKRDPIQLCIEDKHGQTPLEYVRAELTGEWIDFLEQHATKYLDQPLKLQSPKERRPEGTLVDPPNSIGVSLAALVSSGAVSPEQMAQMDEDTRKNYKARG